MLNGKKWKSASQQFRFLIDMSDNAIEPDFKMTDNEIYEAVVTQFGNLKVSRSHVGWHRSKMKSALRKPAQ